MREIAHFRRVVLAHTRMSARHTLPWRQTHDPYRILVSEIMLQQTQVERVIPFYLAFLKKFPTVQALANASLDDVLTEWSGLGYNRRAKMLHECAKTVTERYGGKVPRDFAALVSLPGIGAYTAGAIRAFAFNEPGVFIETNIRAALIHHFFPRAKKVSDDRLKPLLESLESAPTLCGPREWYAALMDYGAHVKRMYPNPSRRSAHHTKQSKFEGSLRQVRGAILKAITRKTPLKDVREAYAKKFQEAMESLVRDGLIAFPKGSTQTVRS